MVVLTLQQSLICSLHQRLSTLKSLLMKYGWFPAAIEPTKKDWCQPSTDLKWSSEQSTTTFLVITQSKLTIPKSWTELKFLRSICFSNYKQSTWTTSFISWWVQISFQDFRHGTRKWLQTSTLLFSIGKDMSIFWTHLYQRTIRCRQTMLPFKLTKIWSEWYHPRR